MRFIFSCQETQASAEKEKEELEAHGGLGVEDDDYHEDENKLFGFLTFNMSVTIWLIFNGIEIAADAAVLALVVAQHFSNMFFVFVATFASKRSLGGLNGNSDAGFGFLTQKNKNGHKL